MPSVVESKFVGRLKARLDDLNGLLVTGCGLNPLETSPEIGWLAYQRLMAEKDATQVCLDMFLQVLKEEEEENDRR